MVRQSTRGPALYLQCTLLLIALTLIFAWISGLLSQHDHEFNAVSRAFFQLTPRQLIFAAVLTAHWLIVTVLSITTTSRNLQDQRRRHWLATISSTPAHRPELVLAEAVSAAVRRLCVHLTPLPLYALLIQLTGVDWRTVVCFYGILIAADFAVLPVPSPPAVNVTAARRLLLGNQARRRMTPATRITANCFALAFIFIAFSNLPGTGLAKISTHLGAPIGVTNVFDLIRFQFTFAYIASKILTQPVPFFHGWIMPWIFIFLTVAALQVASALDAGAGVGSIEAGETVDDAASRRAKVATNACVYLIFFGLIGYAWRTSIMAGDLAGLVMTSSGIITRGLSVAGLLMAVGAAIPPLVMLRVMVVATHTRDGSPRRMLGMMRRWLMVAGRAAGGPLSLYLAVCLCGLTNPLPQSTFIPLLRIAAATGSTIVFAAGVKRLISTIKAIPRKSQGAQTRQLPPVDRGSYAGLVVGAGFAASIAALFSPLPIARSVAECLPFYAWIDMFPGSAAALAGWQPLAASSGVFFYTPPPFVTVLIAPALTGLLLLTLSAALGMTFTQAPASRPAPSSRKVVGGDASFTPLSLEGRGAGGEGYRNKRKKARAMLPSFLTQRIDNPVFLRDLRHSLPSPLLQPLTTVIQVLAICSVFTWYQVKSGGGFFASFGLAQRIMNDPIALSIMLTVSLLTAMTFASLLGAGYWTGERMWTAEREQGSLGALLITPMTDPRIALARIAGRLAGVATAPLVILLCSGLLVMIAIADSSVAGFGALWLDAQCFLLMTFLWSVAGGLLASTAVMRFRWLRGLSLLTAIVGPAFTIWAVNYQLPDVESISGMYLFPVALMTESIAISALVCAASIGAAYYFFHRLRRGDIDYGDQPAK